MEKDNKKTKTAFFILFLFIVLMLLMLLVRSCKKEALPAPQPQPVKVRAVGKPALDPVAEKPSVAVAVSVSKPIASASAPVAVPVTRVKPALKAPRTKIVEKSVRSGNKGYFILNKQYVYFGIYAITREEVPAE